MAGTNNINVNCLYGATMWDSEKDVKMSERLDTGESVSGDGDGDQQDLPHPWPYLKEFFEIIEKIELSIHIAASGC